MGEQYIMKGGTPLKGEVVIGGAKNAALGILAAAVMSNEDCHIDNMPNVRDINILLQAIESIGAKVNRVNDNEVIINGAGIDSSDDLIVDNEFIRKMRASYYLIGALLGKYKKAVVTLPGGCEIGARPIDQHIKGFRALGAKVDIKDSRIYVSAEHLVGSHIYMDVVSVGATINVMMAATMADGNTIIENAAKEPHVVDVANFLNSMGADVRGAGTDVIRIKGVEKFHETRYSIIPDQIEAGTFMMAAAITKGDILVKNIIPKHMEAISAKLIEMGAEVKEFDTEIRVKAEHRLKHTQVMTLPYPGYPTDMQPQIGVTLGIAEGKSFIIESIFENRFRYFEELQKMGAAYKIIDSDTAIITGVEKYKGAKVHALDLRAGASLVIAGLAAEGFTNVVDIVYIQRGYERFVEKLQGLGANIAMVNSEEEVNKFKFENQQVGE